MGGFSVSRCRRADRAARTRFSYCAARGLGNGESVTSARDQLVALSGLQAIASRCRT